MNTIPDLRMEADALFESQAFETPVTVYFDLYPNFFSDAGFMLQYRRPVEVSAVGPARRLEASPTAIAELSVKRAIREEWQWVPIAQYYMPFSMTVTPCPTSGCH
ncbi:MAG: hypothetical protein C5B57_12450 [Blastocatellia bacterium]|nr:MAG: hypothetical protein C5B57_12450 [Blastocatellia bacterium]